MKDAFEAAIETSRYPKTKPNCDIRDAVISCEIAVGHHVSESHRLISTRRRIHNPLHRTVIVNDPNNPPIGRAGSESF
jgi:hypothetical protein